MIPAPALAGEEPLRVLIESKLLRPSYLAIWQYLQGAESFSRDQEPNV